MEKASSKKTILIVEDDASSLKTVQSILGKKGFEVEIAENGQKAVKMLEKNTQFGLILLDLAMPGVSGFDVLKYLKEKRVKAKVVVFSNLGSDKDITKARNLGVNDYLVKSQLSIGQIVEEVEKRVK